MIIIKANGVKTKDHHDRITKNLQEQAKTGLIVLPEFCDLLCHGPESGQPMVIRETPVYSLRKKGVICSMSNLSYCGYTVEELQKLQAEGFELYADETRIKL